MKKLPKNSLEYKEEKEFIEWLKERPHKVKELEKDRIAKHIIKGDNSDSSKEEKKKTSNRKGMLIKSTFDPYREEIISLLEKGNSLDKILNVIKVGSRSSLCNYIRSRNLREEVNLHKEKIN